MFQRYPKTIPRLKELTKLHCYNDSYIFNSTCYSWLLCTQKTVKNYFFGVPLEPFCKFSCSPQCFLQEIVVGQKPSSEDEAEVNSNTPGQEEVDLN